MTSRLSGLRRKIVVLFLLIGLVPLVCASVISLLHSQSALRRAIGASQRDLALEIMDKIDREISFAFTLETSWANLPIVAQAMVEGSQRASQVLESQWQQDGLTETTTARLLKDFERVAKNRFKEILLTDVRGHVIAATNKTTDFDQGPADDPPNGEAWWAAAMANGVYIGGVDYDESADLYSFKIVLRVDVDAKPVGVLMALYNMENIQNLVGAASKRDTWYYELVNEKGLIIAGKERDQLLSQVAIKLHESGRPTPAPTPVHQLFQRSAGSAVGVDRQGNDVLIGYARSTGLLEKSRWMLLSYVSLQEAYSLLFGQLLWFACVSSVAGVAIFIVSFTFASRIVSELAEKELFAQELQTAHEMQMGLLPKQPPIAEGLEVAGRCVPANHVGGDLYRYHRRNGRTCVSMADVTGHAMEAAIPAVMFSGMVDAQMETSKTLEELFGALNRSLCRSLALGRHTFIGFTMAEIDTKGRSVRVANCGLPYPLHYRASTGEVTEFRVDAYPLGVREDTVYRTIEAPLVSGDYLVLVSDGIPETATDSQQLFGFERTAEVIRQGCSEGRSADALIDHLLAQVNAFRAGTPQSDDMTCVVVRVEG